MKDANETPRRPRYVPLSTYRLQIRAGFPLAAARDIVGYLAGLGISTCYTSPYFTAVPGSNHGYDVLDHNEINPELGGAEALAGLKTALAAEGIGHLVDFVPNHMGVGTGQNARWNDVLENGQSSPAAAFFDIEWAPDREELQSKLLLPVLGDQYGRVLERGELVVVFRDGQLILKHGDMQLPINPRQSPRVFKLALEPLTAALGGDHPALHEFQSIVTSLQKLPPYTERRQDLMAERQREKDVARTRLARLVAETPVVGEQIEVALQGFNGEPGKPASFDPLHELLESQPYRLCVLAHRLARDQLPPLLRRQLAGRAAGRAAGGVRGDPQAARDAAARGNGRRRTDRSPGRPVQSRQVFRDAAGDGGPRVGDRAHGRSLAAALRGRGKNPVGPGGAPARMGGPRHDGLQLSERSERVVRQRRARPAHAARIREADRAHRGVRRRGVREQAADHGNRHGQRAERARPDAHPGREGQPAVARLHAREPAGCHRGSDRLLPRLPHVCRRAGLDDRGPRHRRAGDLACAAPQPGDGGLALRLLPGGDARTRRRHRPPARRTPGRVLRPPTRTRRASGCLSP